MLSQSRTKMQSVAHRSKQMCNSMLLVLFTLLLLKTTEAYVAFSARKAPQQVSSTAVYSLGNWISGVTGVPPPQLLEPSMKDQILANTSLEKVDLVCAYKASRDGWSATKFHECVDGRGSGLVVALGRSGAVFGGFNPLGWMSTDDYGNSNSAFLWFMKGDKVEKCRVLSGGNAAIFDYATGGPCFGAADLILGAPRAAVMGGFAGPDMEDTSASAGNLKEGSSNVGGAYTFTSGWPARGNFQLAEVEAYCNSAIVPDRGGQGRSWWPF